MFDTITHSVCINTIVQCINTIVQCINTIVQCINTIVQCEELRKTKRHIEEKLAQSEGVIMSLQKENNKLQDDIFRLKSERTRLHNKVRVLSIGDCLILS